MRDRRTLMYVLTLAALGWHPLSQAAAPASTDQVERLGFYVGNWAEEGRMRADPAGEFVPMTGHETCKWLKGNLVVQCDETVNSKAGSSVATYLLGYDAIARHYFVFGTDDGGNILSGDGRLEGDQWTWTVQVNDGESTSRWRYVFRPEPGSARSMQVSLATSDTEWARMQEVTYSRKK
jgi:hypothetical protein